MSLALVIFFVVSLVACGGNQTSQTTPTTAAAAEQSSSSAVAATAADKYSEFIDLSFYVPGDPPTNGTLEKVSKKWNELLKAKINAGVTLKWIGWTDWQTKYDLIMASGEPYDLTCVGDWLNFWPNVLKGAYMPLNDLLQKNAPNLYAEYTQQEWEDVTFNKNIYIVPETHYSQWTNQGFFYRGDWAKEFGITEPIKDFETLGKYFQGVKDKKPDVIPYDVNAGTKYEPFWGWVQSHTDANLLDMVSTGFLNLFWNKSYDDRYTVWSPIFGQTFVDEAVMMKDWADKGYWRKDALTFTGDTRSELKAGKSGADAHHTQTYRTLRFDMDQSQPGSDLQMFAYSDTRGNLLRDSPVHGGVSIGVDSKNPDRALAALEVIHQDKDVYRLFEYGIEGEQYVVKDGLKALPDGYNADKQGFSANMWGPRNDACALPSATEYPGIYDIFKQNAAKAHPYPYTTFVFDSSPIKPELAALSNITTQMGPAIIWGKAGDPVKAVTDFRDKLKAAGFDKVMTEIQKQLDAYKAQVGGK